LNIDDIKKAGLKITAPRIHILKILETNKLKHMSAEDIYQQLYNQNIYISLATIYRVLTQFESAGLILKHNFESGHSIFELNRGKHHDHLVCIICGFVEEFYDGIIEERQKEISNKFNFNMTDHYLTLYGKCKKCNSALKNKE
jgi:Fur family ferric uptake transcriptional regulator